MRKTSEGRSPVGILLPGTAAGLLLVLLLMLAGAVLVQRGALGEDAILPCALAFLAAGSAVAAFIAVRRSSGKGFSWAVSAGALVFLILLLGGLPLTNQPMHLLRVAISLLCALAAAAVGGFAGAGKRKKKRYRHLKK